MDILAFWYQVIIASEHLLVDAISMLDNEGWEKSLKEFYEEHYEEEQHHARWLREDLGDHPVVLHYGAAQLAGMTYYLIRHVHPVALMGYMLALEGNPIDMKFVEEMEAAHGKSAVRTLRHHAEEDPGHYEELKSAMAFIPDEWKPLVENTRIQTLKLLGCM